MGFDTSNLNVGDKVAASPKSLDHVFLHDTTDMTDTSILSSLPRLHIDKRSPTIPGYTDSPMSSQYGSDKKTFEGPNLNYCDTSGTVTRKSSFANLDSLHVEHDDQARKLDKIRIAVGCYAYFVCGWGDGGPSSFRTYIE